MNVDAENVTPRRFRDRLGRPLALLVFVFLLMSGAFYLLLAGTVDNVHGGESPSFWGILAFTGISAAGVMSLWGVLVWEDRRACIRKTCEIHS